MKKREHIVGAVKSFSSKLDFIDETGVALMLGLGPTKYLGYFVYLTRHGAILDFADGSTYDTATSIEVMP